jgi:phenylacetic acid degradation protein paaN
VWEQHRATLDRAVQATRERTYWSPYPETPSGSIYGETARDEGKAAFDAHLGKRFALDQPATVEWAGEERSPYGLELGITYPVPDLAGLVEAATAALPSWRDAGPDARAGVLLEVLDRLNRRSFEIGHATMHTTGQPFVMAFQAGGPHAQDRGLEALAYAHEEMTRHAARAYWEKPQGKREPLRLDKTFRVVPRGLAAVVGCNTFPNWNGYPGLFASLATGNPTVVKPHRRGVLPLAITVQVAREVLAESGFDPNVVTLAGERPGERLASSLATRPEVRLIDFTGSSAYGVWLEQHARQAQVYAEKSGVNSIVIDSTDDLEAMAANVAFSLALYSGQMCTAPQNVLVPRDGIDVAGQRRTLADVEAAIRAAIERLVADPAQAVEVIGAIVSEDVLARLEGSTSFGRVIQPSRSIEHPVFPDAVVRTPLLLGVDAADEAAYGEERFGPISFVVATDSTAHSLEILRRTARARGAITAAVYSTSEDVLRRAEDAAAEAGVNLAANLTGNIWINQSAAFSDFHATGANPAANACFTDAAFVAGRFRLVESRRPAAAPPEPAA